MEDLNSQSKRPHHCPNTKLTEDIETLILDLRKTRNLGIRRLQSELLRNYDVSLSLATIHNVLSKHQVTPVKKFRRKHEYIRYERALPSDRVQRDTCKLSSNLYQDTSLDDYTRYHVLRIYKRRTTENTLNFIDCVIEEIPFPIQRIKTDRGREFLLKKVQKKLMQFGIKFRPNKPA